ncbi:MAG: WG repeat-containing protein, partial [Zoogloeaceae bacterium]|nr:WG repeat-containing protein [Zoogloeaceae bacterium]
MIGWMLLSGLLVFGLGCKAEEAVAWAIEPRFDEAGNFAANGLARVRIKDKWSYIDAQGEEVIPSRFETRKPVIAQ